jgi:hypothetical protein
VSWWAKLFGGGGAVAAVAGVVDKAIYTDQEKAADDSHDTASARAFAAPVSAGGYFGDLVDACNRAIRPGVTVWLLGGFVGWWQFPDPGRVDPFYHTVLLLVLTFWFGGRVLLKDLPATVAVLLALKRGR